MTGPAFRHWRKRWIRTLGSIVSPGAGPSIWKDDHIETHLTEKDIESLTELYNFLAELDKPEETE